MADALQVINADLITPQQTEYVMAILTLVMECQRPVQDKFIKFPLFGVIAALSERIVALDDVVTKCLNKMDCSALKAKMAKARDMFFVCDPQSTVRFLVTDCTDFIRAISHLMLCALSSRLDVSVRNTKMKQSCSCRLRTNSSCRSSTFLLVFGLSLIHI